MRVLLGDPMKIRLNARLFFTYWAIKGLHKETLTESCDFNGTPFECREIYTGGVKSALNVIAFFF